MEKYSIFKIAVIIKNDISQLGERGGKKVSHFSSCHRLLVLGCEALLWGVLLGNS